MIEDEVHRTGAMFSPLFRGIDVKQAREHRHQRNLPRLPPLFSSRINNSPQCISHPSATARYQLLSRIRTGPAAIRRVHVRPTLVSGQKCKKWQRILIKAEGAFSIGQPLSRRTGDWLPYTQLLLHDIDWRERFYEEPAVPDSRLQVLMNQKLPFGCRESSAP
jgi:hypothetical protein